MGILAEIDELYAKHGKAAPGQEDPGAPDAAGPFFPEPAFQRGLRAGGEDIAANLHGLAGQAGEVMGANDFAASQRAQARAGGLRAEQAVQGIPQTYREAQGAGGVWDYATGMLGRAGPTMGAGLVGAALGPPGWLGSIAGMTATTAPLMMGANFNEQQADPVQAAAPLLDRTVTGALAGTGEAAAMSVVPGVVGGKLFGKAAAQQAMPFLKAAAVNVPEAVLGNAAAGNVTARIGQAAASELNPGRDTSHDEQQQWDATTSGGILGAAFAPAGIAGSMRGAKVPKPSVGLGAALKTFEKEADSGIVDATAKEVGQGKKPGEAASEKAKPRAAASFDDQLAELTTPLQKPDLTTGREHADATITGDETVETMAAKDAAGNAAAQEKARARVDQLTGDPAAAHLHDELGGLDLASEDGQRRVSELGNRHTQVQEAKQTIAKAEAALDVDYTPFTEPGQSDSRDYSGVEAKIRAIMDEKFDARGQADTGAHADTIWPDFDEPTKQAATRVARKMITLGERTGKIPMLNEARAVFGTNNPEERLLRVYNVLRSSDPQARENFFGALERSQTRQKRDDGLAYAVYSALPTKQQGWVPRSQINEFVEGMKALSAEHLSKTMGANELKVAKTRIDDKLIDYFGAEQAEKLIAAFAKHAKESEELVPADVEENAKVKSVDETRSGRAADDYGHELSVTSDHVPTDDLGKPLYEGEAHKYYGRTPTAGNASPFELNNEAHRAAYPNAPDETRPQNVKTALAHKENPEFDQSGHPGGEVRWMGAREFADLHNMSREQLDAHTKGRPGDYGLAVVRTRSADEHALTSEDAEAMKFANHVKSVDKKTGEMTERHLKAPAHWFNTETKESLITVGQEEDALHFDATRIASYMKRVDGRGKGMKYTEADNDFGEQYRTARAFSEGISALSIKLRRDSDDAQLRGEVAAAKARGETLDEAQIEAMRRAIEQANDEKRGQFIDVPDDVVVVKAKGDEKAQTWGELKQRLKDGNATQQVRASLHPLRAQRDALFDNRAQAREKVQNDNPDADAKELHALMNESDAAFAKPLADMNKKIAALREKHGLIDNSERLHNERLAEVNGHQDALARLAAAKDIDQGERAVQAAQLEESHAERLTKLDAKIDDLTNFEIGGPKTRAEQITALRAATARATAALDTISPDARELLQRKTALAEMRRVAAQALGGLDDEAGQPGRQDNPKAKWRYQEDGDNARPATQPPRQGDFVRDFEKEALGQRAQAAYDFATTMMKNERGALSIQDRAAIKTFAKLEKRLDAAQARLDQGDRPGSDLKVELTGRQQVDANDANIIEAAVEHYKKDKPNNLGNVSAAMRQTAGEYTAPARPGDAAPVTPDARRDTLAKLADDLAAKTNPAARAVGEKLRLLIDNHGILSKGDKAVLGDLIGDDGKMRLKKVSELAPIVGGMVERYQQQRGWSTEGANSWSKVASEGGGQHVANLKNIDAATDPKSLHTNLLELLAIKHPNQHALKVIDATNERIGILMADDPAAAYAMQLKSRQASAAAEAAAKLPTPAQQAFIDRAGKGGESTDAVIAAISKDSNTAALQRAQRTLAMGDAKNPDVARVAAAIADRLDTLDLQGGEEARQELAYALKHDEGPTFGPGDVLASGAKGPPLGERIKGVDSTNPYFSKDIAKAQGADKFIGRGSARSSTEKYRQAAGGLANTGVYAAGERVFVSVEGNRGGRMALDTNEVQKALDAGATIIADSNADRARPYNVGERELADYLAKNGYEEKGQGVWKPADDTKFSREKQGTGTSSAAAQAGVHNYVNKVTGRDAAVNAAASMLYAGSYLKGGKDAAGVDYRPAINVSVHALDPLSTAYHESLHWFADHLRQHGDPAVFAALTKAADSAYVRNFLRTKFRDQPDALKQVDGSAEERIAYMYQFHKNGELKLGDRGKTILDHIAGFFERVFGVWSNDARALHIMDYFGSGKYADAMVGPDVKGNAAIAHKAMMEVGRNKALDRLHARVKPLREVADALGSIGSARIRDYGIPALTKIVDLTRLHDTKEGVDPGYLPAAGVERRARSMALVKALGKFTMEQADAAFERIALGHKDGTDTHQTGLMDAMRQTMFNMHGYMKGAGVDIGERGLNTNYTPRVWNPTKVAARQDAFRTMIQKYIDSGQFKGTADDLMSRLMRDDGSELPTPRPGDQHVKERSLHFITAEDAQPFLETDALRILTSYIAQGTRRAEWARRFEGKNADGVTKLDELRTAAVEQGATPDQMKVLDNYLLGVTGRLGADISPGTRKLFGQLQVYQNLRVLPLGFFSMLIDPGGVKVRGGSWGDAFNNLKRGLLEIPRGFQKVENRKSDAGYQFAEDLGVIDAAVLQHVLGAAYGLGGLGDTARTVNEAVFKWNLMDQMNTSQRVGATEAAMRFLLRHKDGDASEHSMRYLSELGIKPADIELARQGTGQGAKRIGAPQKDGFERIQRGERIAVTEQDFLDLGYNAKQALAAHLRMRQAVNRWVDGAVLRPDQSSKAIWMNDPLFALVAHMKQFAFSFQDTVIKRVMHEARHGNYAPATALASYIPMMLAADFAKGLVQGGGSQPSWKKDWDLTDWMVNSTQRAGLFGQNQFGIDAFKDIRRGGTGIGALGGPSVSQLTGVISAVGGRRSMHSTIIDALPANALWSGYMGKTGGSAGRSDGHRGGETTGFEPHEVDRGDP